MTFWNFFYGLRLKAIDEIFSSGIWLYLIWDFLLSRGWKLRQTVWDLEIVILSLVILEVELECLYGQ